jgi:hexosaminidase
MTKFRVPVGQLRTTDPLADYLSSFLAGSGSLPLVYQAKAFPNEGHYHLKITAETLLIEGNRANGLSALLRLVEKEGEQTYLPILDQEDEPRYPWRGVLLDEARHYFGKAEVKRLLDQMFLLRYNVLHWHLSDDQGFRLGLKKYPELAKASERAATLEGWGSSKKKRVIGPYGFAYSEEDISEIVKYASARGIEIVPEIDGPGHLSAILSVHPEFSCEKKAFPVPENFGILPHTLCLGSAKAKAYFIGLIDEVAYLFKAKHFHLGFDEIKTGEMKDCPACQKAMRDKGLKNEKELIATFQKELTAHLRQRGVVPLFWNDGMKEKEDDAIEEVWDLVHLGLKKRAISQINHGQKALISPFFSTYASNAYAVMPLRRTFAFDPLLNGIKRPQNVLGSEICYWSEYGYSAAKLHFEFDVRAAILAATLWGEKKGSFEEFRQDLQRKSSFFFGQNITIDEALMNPRGPARLKQLWHYFQDVDSEWRRYQV